MVKVSLIKRPVPAQLPVIVAAFKHSLGDGLTVTKHKPIFNNRGLLSDHPCKVAGRRWAVWISLFR